MIMLRVNIILIVCVFMFGCASSSDTKPKKNIPEVFLGHSFSLQEGGMIRVANTSITITFHKLLNDSRCPRGKQCVWQGVASIVLNIKDKKGHHALTLDTLSGQNFSQSKYYAAYKISLLNLSRSRHQGKYRVDLKIE